MGLRARPRSRISEREQLHPFAVSILVLRIRGGSTGAAPKKWYRSEGQVTSRLSNCYPSGLPLNSFKADLGPTMATALKKV